MSDIEQYTPRTGRVLREDSTFINEADYWSEARGLFQSLTVTERTPIVELKSVYGISALRDIVTVAGEGSVTHSGAGAAAEYAVATTAAANDAATLDSAERGRYAPGAAAEAGIGVRLAAATLTGEQVATWGYSDNNNGFYFGLDATGLYVAVLRAGEETKIRRADWNGDKLDGTGPSGLTLDLTAGSIYQIKFSWYGYGAIYFQVVQTDARGRQDVITVHRFTPSGETSTRDPNLPIRAKVVNGATATAQTLYVGGRQFSILGKFEPNRRLNGQYRASALGSVGDTFLPLISFRRKSAFESVSVKLEGFDMLAGHDMYWQIRVGGTLTAPTFAAPLNTTAAETACEVDVLASAISGGQILHPGGIVPASTNQAASLVQENGIGFDVPALQPVTLCVRRVAGGSGNVTAAVLRWREEW